MTVEHKIAGDPLSIRARDWNELADAAAHVRNGGFTRGERPGSLRRRGTVIIKNDSGLDYYRGEAMVISGLLFDPDGAEAAALAWEQNDWCLLCDEPSEHRTGHFVVLAEHIKAGNLGQAYVDGVFPALVEIHDDEHRFADVRKENPWLQSVAGPGGVEILYKSETEPAQCVVRSCHADEWYVCKASGAVTKGNNGTFAIWSTSTLTGFTGTKGAEVDTERTISAYARMADIDDEAWCLIRGIDGEFEVVQVECTES